MTITHSLLRDHHTVTSHVRNNTRPSGRLNSRITIHNIVFNGRSTRPNERNRGLTHRTHQCLPSRGLRRPFLHPQGQRMLPYNQDNDRYRHQSRRSRSIAIISDTINLYKTNIQRRSSIRHPEFANTLKRRLFTRTLRNRTRHPRNRQVAKSGHLTESPSIQIRIIQTSLSSKRLGTGRHSFARFTFSLR